MAESNEQVIDVVIGDRIKVERGDYKGHSGEVVNVHVNTCSVRFDDTALGDGTPFISGVRHSEYKKI
ncbi:hypothetical protein [Shouchella patagoniensis]|uniref:hypothetical protein n=1 Tax=Shouchella patagoniensis TaxID=228576 RepID=UPI0009949D63|nr:hypothetical protein [Shouchella patagoniensis]